MFELDKSMLVDKLQTLVKNIVGALIELLKHKKFVSDNYRMYELKDK